MIGFLPAYYAYGLYAIPVDVIVDGDRVRAFEPESGRLVHSVMLESSGSVSSVVGHGVNVRTSPLRKRGPERLAARICYLLSPIYPECQQPNID
jgi:hypothetical protein